MRETAKGKEESPRMAKRMEILLLLICKSCTDTEEGVLDCLGEISAGRGIFGYMLLWLYLPCNAVDNMNFIL